MKKFFALLLSLTMVLTMLVPMAAAPNAQPVDLTEDLLIHYTFDETGDTVADATGLGNDLTMNTGNNRVTGIIGSGAMHFCGQNKQEATPSHIFRGDTPTSITNGKLSISTWVKIDTSLNVDQNIFRFGTSPYLRVFTQGGSGNIGIYTYHYDENAADGPHIYDHAWAWNSNDGNPVWNNGWNHVVMTMDAANDALYFYVNGEKYAATAANQVDVMDLAYFVDLGLQGSVELGGYDGWGWSPLKGDMDDFRLYGDVLTDDEVAALYDMLPEYEKDMLFHITFDETDDKVYDSMGVYGPVTTTSNHTRIPGVFGNGLKWGGADAALAFNNAAGAIGTQGKLTWSIWLKYDSSTDARPGSIMQMGHGPWYTAYADQAVSSNYLYLNSTGGAYAAAFNAAPSVAGQERYEFANSGLFSRELQMSDGWFNWTITYDGTTMTHYVDGIPHMSYTMTWDPTDGNMYLGQYGFNGAMDDFRVYDKALSAADVYALVARGKNPDLLFEYKFDETDGTRLYDYDSGNYFTMDGGNTRVPGLVGNALKFDGTSTTSDPLDSNLTSVLGRWTANKLDNGKLSVSMWVNMEDNGTDADQTLFAFGNPSIRLFVQNGGNLGLWTENVGTAWAWNAGDINIEGKSGWYHIVATLDMANDSVVFYINGEKYVARGDDNVNMPDYAAFTSADYYLYLGGYRNNGWTPFKGTMDEVQIFSDILTENEVKAMYNAVNDEHTHDYTGAVWGPAGDNKHTAYCTSAFCTDYEGSLKSVDCADETDDHLCDECTQEISECVDTTPKDHVCDICDEPMAGNENCADTEGDGDHNCDHCGEAMDGDECSDDDDDHLCDECNTPVSTCVDTTPKDHFCDICGEEMEGNEDCTDAATDGDHNCDYCGAEDVTECADAANDGDHKCDDCRAEGVTECADAAGDGDHDCDDCGEAVTSSDCDDADEDHLCDECDEPLSECADDDDDHYCDLCGELVPDAHIWEQAWTAGSNGHYHKCSVDECNGTTTPVSHEDSDTDNDFLCDECGYDMESAHVCTPGTDWEYNADEHFKVCTDPTCGMMIASTIGEHADEDPTDHYCDVCGAPVSDHADAEGDGDHKCDTCGAPVDNCEDAENDGDHDCDECGETVPGAECEDTDDDHLCDECGEEVSECKDEDDDHLCDICGEEVSECEDEDDDHLCDICGEEVSECEDEDDDHLCDVCGDEVSECEDEDDDHLCDICGDEVSECKDNDNDHNCDLCGDEVSECEEGTTKDHKCDVCGATVSQCAEGNTKDHKCDVCSKVLGTCADADSDGTCDVCGDDVELDNPPTFDAMTIVAFTALVSTAGVVLTKKRRK